MKRAIASAVVFCWAVIANAQYTTIPFAYNAQLANWLPEFSPGNVTLGGVPFNIPTSGNNAWHSDEAYYLGPNPHSITIPVNVFGIDRVSTLINSFWGESAPGTEASIQFNGDGGASYTVNLDGGVDTRDFFAGTHANTINGTSTVNVFNTGSKRLDMQTFALPAAFRSQTLASVRLTDNGQNWQGFYLPTEQRDFLAGLTVHHSPTGDRH